MFLHSSNSLLPGLDPGRHPAPHAPNATFPGQRLGQQPPDEHGPGCGLGPSSARVGPRNSTTPGKKCPGTQQRRERVFMSLKEGKKKKFFFYVPGGLFRQLGRDAGVRRFPGVSMEMSLLGMRGTAGPQPRQGLAQGHPEGHGQGRGCCLPSWGLSGLVPAGDTGLGEARGRGEPPPATSLVGSSREPHPCSGLSRAQGCSMAGLE